MMRGPLALLALGLLAAAPDDALESRAERGPVRVTVWLAPRDPAIGDPVELVLEARAPEGVELLMPEFGEALDRFRVLDFVPLERLELDGTMVATQRYRLDPPFSGPQRIPPLLIEFVDRRPGREPAPEGADAYELLTERIDFEVRSVLPSGALPDLRPMPEALRLSSGGWTVARLWIAVAALAAAVGAVGLWRRGAAWRQERLRRSAYQIALEALEGLIARGLPSREQVSAFYVELSGIIRAYLENRFGLRSPELTTEEFLEIASGSPDLTPELRQLLAEFLRGADLVKFARHLPQASEIHSSIGAARRVLLDTRRVEEAA